MPDRPAAPAAPWPRWLPVALQAAASAGYGVVELARLPSAHRGDQGVNATVGAFFLVLAVLLAGLAVELRRARRWARGPAVTLEIIALPIGVTMLRGHVWVPGVLLIVLAGVELAAIAAQARADTTDAGDG